MSTNRLQHAWCSAKRFTVMCCRVQQRGCADNTVLCCPNVCSDTRSTNSPYIIKCIPPPPTPVPAMNGCRQLLQTTRPTFLPASSQRLLLALRFYRLHISHRSACWNICWLLLQAVRKLDAEIARLKAAAAIAEGVAALHSEETRMSHERQLAAMKLANDLLQQQLAKMAESVPAMLRSGPLCRPACPGISPTQPGLGSCPRAKLTLKPACQEWPSDICCTRGAANCWYSD